MNRAARRRGDSPRKRQWRAVVYAALALVAFLGLVGVVFALFRSGGDDSSANASRGGPEPTLDGPASRFVANQEDLGNTLQGVPNESRAISPDIYADSSVGPFTDTNQGREKVRDWDYQEGFIGAMQPDGLIAGVVQGRYFVRMEAHLYGSVSTAIDAFNWYNNVYAGIEGIQEENASPLANQSRAWKSLQGKVENTDLDRVYHRFVFRRGNLVGIVQTVGADTFMTIDPARNIAAIMDEKALGNRAAPTPTPSGGEQPQPTPPAP